MEDEYSITSKDITVWVLLIFIASALYFGNKAVEPIAIHDATIMKCSHYPGYRGLGYSKIHVKLSNGLVEKIITSNCLHGNSIKVSEKKGRIFGNKLYELTAI